MTTETARIERAVYDALRDFQQTADWPQLRLAQMRQHLAEHIARDLALTPGALPADPDSVSVRDLAHALDNSTPYPVELTPTVAGFMAERLLEMLVIGKRAEHLVWQPEEQPELGPQPQPEDPAAVPAVVAPRTDQAAAEAALTAVETALGDTLTADAREEALAGIAAVLPAPADRAADPVCICGHTEERHFEDVCQTCGCGDYLEPQDAAEVIARWRQAALKVRAGERAAVLREEADRIDATRADFPIAVQNGITWATAEMRRHAADAQPEPGARHVHITIHHPDPTTAHTAAQAIADLIRGEYSDSHRLTITTDAPGTGAAPAPVEHAPGKVIRCAACRAKGYAVCLDDPAAGARQDGGAS